MRYLSPNNIKLAAAKQPDPEREKNLLGKIMPAVAAGLTGTGCQILGWIMHPKKINSKLDFALALANITGSGALGYTAGKKLQDQPTNKLPEIFLKAPNDTIP